MPKAKKKSKQEHLTLLKKNSARASSVMINRLVGELLRDARGARPLSDEEKKTAEAAKRAALKSGKPAPEKPRRFTQTELAAAIGIDQSAFSRVENGFQQLTIGQWILLHEYKILSPEAISQVLKKLADPVGATR